VPVDVAVLTPPCRRPAPPPGAPAHAPGAAPATNGALLGLAVTSRIGFWLWYVVPLAAFLSAAPVAGAIVWGLYGLARLRVLDLVAMNIAFSEDAGYAVTRRLLKSGGRARALLVPVAVVTGVATALLMGL
jgi:hypothetical protein